MYQKSEHYSNGHIINDTMKRKGKEEMDNSSGPTKPLTITTMASTNLEMRTAKIERQGPICSENARYKEIVLEVVSRNYHNPCGKRSWGPLRQMQNSI